MAEKLDFENLSLPSDFPIIEDMASFSKSKETLNDVEVDIPEVESLEDFSKPTPKASETEEPEEEVVEDDEEEEIEIPQPDDNTQTEIDSENKAWATYLQSKGWLEEFEEEEFEDSEEWVEQKLAASLEKKALESLDPRIREINEKFKKGVPLDALLEIEADKDALSELTAEDLEEDETLAERIVAEQLALMGESTEDIMETIETYKDANLLGKQATKALKFVKNHKEKQIAEMEKEAQKAQEMREKQEAQNLSMLKTKIEQANEFINGVPLSKDDKPRLFEATTKVGKDGMTEYQRMLSDPEMQFKVAQFVVLMKGDLSKIENKIKTKVTKQVKNSVSTYQDKPRDLKSDAEKALAYIKSKRKI